MIFQCGLHDPLPIPLVVSKRPFSDLLPGQGELGTAGYSDDIGDWLAGEELFEGGGVGDFCCFGGFGV